MKKQRGSILLELVVVLIVAVSGLAIYLNAQGKETMRSEQMDVAAVLRHDGLVIQRVVADHPDVAAQWAARNSGEVTVADLAAAGIQAPIVTSFGFSAADAPRFFASLGVNLGTDGKPYGYACLNTYPDMSPAHYNTSGWSDDAGSPAVAMMAGPSAGYTVNRAGKNIAVKGVAGLWTLNSSKFPICNFQNPTTHQWMGASVFSDPFPSAPVTHSSGSSGSSGDWFCRAVSGPLNDCNVAEVDVDMNDHNLTNIDHLDTAYLLNPDAQTYLAGEPSLYPGSTHEQDVRYYGQDMPNVVADGPYVESPLVTVTDKLYVHDMWYGPKWVKWADGAVMVAHLSLPGYTGCTSNCPSGYNPSDVSSEIGSVTFGGLLILPGDDYGFSNVLCGQTFRRFVGGNIYGTAAAYDPATGKTSRYEANGCLWDVFNNEVSPSYAAIDTNYQHLFFTGAQPIWYSVQGAGTLQFSKYYPYNPSGIVRGEYYFTSAMNPITCGGTSGAVKTFGVDHSSGQSTSVDNACVSSGSSCSPLDPFCIPSGPPSSSYVTRGVVYIRPN